MISSNDIQHLIYKGNNYFNQKKYEEAINTYQDALKKTNNNNTESNKTQLQLNISIISCQIQKAARSHTNNDLTLCNRNFLIETSEKLTDLSIRLTQFVQAKNNDKKLKALQKENQKNKKNIELALCNKIYNEGVKLLNSVDAIDVNTLVNGSASCIKKLKESAEMFKKFNLIDESNNINHLIVKHLIDVGTNLIWFVENSKDDQQKSNALFNANRTFLKIEEIYNSFSPDLGSIFSEKKQVDLLYELYEFSSKTLYLLEKQNIDFGEINKCYLNIGNKLSNLPPIHLSKKIQDAISDFNQNSNRFVSNTNELKPQNSSYNEDKNNGNKKRKRDNKDIEPAIPDRSETAESELFKTVSFVDSDSNSTDSKPFLTIGSPPDSLEEMFESGLFSNEFESEFPMKFANIEPEIPAGAKTAESKLLKTVSFVDFDSNSTDSKPFLDIGSPPDSLEKMFESGLFSKEFESEFPIKFANIESEIPAENEANSNITNEITENSLPKSNLQTTNKEGVKILAETADIEINLFNETYREGTKLLDNIDPIDLNTLVKESDSCIKKLKESAEKLKKFKLIDKSNRANQLIAEYLILVTTKLLWFMENSTDDQEKSNAFFYAQRIILETEEIYKKTKPVLKEVNSSPWK